MLFANIPDPQTLSSRENPLPYPSPVAPPLPLPEPLGSVSRSKGPGVYFEDLWPPNH